jgi:hypothetical protein
MAAQRPAGRGFKIVLAEMEGSSQFAQSLRSRIAIWRSWYGSISGPGGIVSIVKVSPTSLLARQMPATQNHGSPFLVNSHRSFAPRRSDAEILWQLHAIELQVHQRRAQRDVCRAHVADWAASYRHSVWC